MRHTWQDILGIAKSQGVITPADVRALGLVPENLNKLAKLGKLEREGTGLYRHPEFEASDRHSLVEVSKSIPDGVICLLSALSLHGTGTQMPWEVWVAIPRGKRIPIARQTRIRAVTMTNACYELGIDVHVLEGVQVKVYCLEKTIIDCFRLRRLIGHEVAIEALREAIRTDKINLSELLRFAGQLRSRRLIQPYLEALL
jgi:predicted transcriptional regulator of viral defense system